MLDICPFLPDYYVSRPAGLLSFPWKDAAYFGGYFFVLFLPWPGSLPVKYEKPFLSLEQQADLLLSRGLQADRQELINLLSSVSYYRFSGYLYPFKTEQETYREGLTLEEVMDLYAFDHKLRLLVLDAVETVEVYFRSRLTYHFCRLHGPFAYTDRSLFPGFDPARDDFVSWQKKLKDQVDRCRKPSNREDFVSHFFSRYGDCHNSLPLWMLAELMDFGTVLSLYRGSDPSLRKTIAAPLGQPEEVVFSWLLSLNTVRNRCAHHSRLWSWNLGLRVKLPNPRKFPAWGNPAWSNGKMGAILMICAHLLHKIGLKEDWTGRLAQLLEEHPRVDLYAMGFPSGWMESELWKSFNIGRAV